MRNVLKLVTVLLLCIPVTTSCSPQSQVPPPAEPESETLSRTEFTQRIENFFEYEALQGGKPSQFLIHLTDLSDGSPVENAEVSLAVRLTGSRDLVVQVKSRVGKVTGIYVAEVTVPNAGEYDIEFHIKNDKLDERMPLSNFKVE